MDQDTYLTLVIALTDEHHDGYHRIPGGPQVNELFSLHVHDWDEVDAFLHDFETQGGA